ncbi:carbohydrate sulfotransferase 1-like [Haliotis cracherodii]|uniref:carbohydrate sulfotransferase 1-like n=1 Tax=Haliotis cracherodii TaxID=6455 RepID=UPI0039E91764
MKRIHHYNFSTTGANANVALQETEAQIHTDTRVILLTYMRSGSTFTSELFQTHPDVFFMFEPLHTTWYYRPKVIPYLHNYKRIYFDDMEKFIKDVKIDTLTKILQCQFKNLDILTLIQEHWHHSKTTKAYKLCTTDQRGVAGIEKCISILTNACSRAKVNFIKTINLTIHEAEQFIDKDPHLKMIYLVRDPRAILSSQMRYGEFVPNSLNSYSEMFCRTMLSDIQGYAKLKKIHPKQVIFVSSVLLDSTGMSVNQAKCHIKSAQTQVLKERLSERPLHRVNVQFAEKISNPAESFAWMESSGLKSETEGFLFAA